MEFSLHTIEGTLFQGNVTAVTVPTHAGQVTILPGHKPLIATTIAGMLRVHTPEEQTIELIGEGVLEVRPESQGVILLLRS